eukprot:5453015-Amphidinium_carterae.1
MKLWCRRVQHAMRAKQCGFDCLKPFFLLSKTWSDKFLACTCTLSDYFQLPSLTAHVSTTAVVIHQKLNPMSWACTCLLPEACISRAHLEIGYLSLVDKDIPVKLFLCDRTPAKRGIEL